MQSPSWHDGVAPRPRGCPAARKLDSAISDLLLMAGVEAMQASSLRDVAGLDQELPDPISHELLDFRSRTRCASGEAARSPVISSRET
jgi:hypothetical protein